MPAKKNSALRWGRRLALSVGVVLLVSQLVMLVLTLPLRWWQPPTSAYISRHEPDSNKVRRLWVPLDKISRHLQIAVIASEDQKFPIHRGIDWESLQDALAQGGRRGASTISQQTIKNLYLWSGRSLARKALEANLAKGSTVLRRRPAPFCANRLRRSAPVRLRCWLQFCRRQPAVR